MLLTFFLEWSIANHCAGEAFPPPMSSLPAWAPTGNGPYRLGNSWFGREGSFCYHRNQPVLNCLDLVFTVQTYENLSLFLFLLVPLGPQLI